ncbi:MAG: tail fiber domain-containing protein [Planctomycetota bacterium]
MISRPPYNLPLLLTTSLVFAAHASAQGLTTFQNGTPANATAVNANFQTVDTKATSAQTAAGNAQATADNAQAIADQNATDVTALTGTVSTLETQVTPLRSAFSTAGAFVGINQPNPQIYLHVTRPSGGDRRPVALFENAACGSACSQGPFPEMIRVRNQNPNGAAGIGFVSTASAPNIGGTPSVWVGSGSAALVGTVVGGERDFFVACRDSAGNLRPRMRIRDNGDCLNTTGAFTAFSDARLKRDVERIEGSDALDSLLQLRGVTFRYTEDALKKHMVAPGLRRGFIAQDVQHVFPTWVKEDDSGMLTVTEMGVSALTVEALRELNSRNRELQAENDELKQRVAGLEEMAERLAQLEAAVQPLLAGKH